MTPSASDYGGIRLQLWFPQRVPRLLQLDYSALVPAQQANLFSSDAAWIHELFMSRAT